MTETQSRNDMREAFFTLWAQREHKETFGAFEQAIIELMEAHPEFHDVFDNREHYLDYDFTGNPEEENPFMHLSLHIAILEQLHNDRPKGIRDIHQSLASCYPTPHDAEHEMMMSLAIELQESQASGRDFDEKSYMARLKQA